MPSVKYNFETEANLGGIRALNSEFKSLTGSLAGSLGVFGSVAAAASVLIDKFNELVEIKASPIGEFSDRLVSLNENLKKVSDSLDAVNTRRREFAEQQAAEDLGQRIRTGDIDEGTARQITKNALQKDIAAAKANAETDPVARAEKKLAVEEEFSKKEASIRDEGDARKQEELNRETQRQQVAIQHAMQRDRDADRVPELQKQEEIAKRELVTAQNRVNALGTAQSALVEISTLAKSGSVIDNASAQKILNERAKNPALAAALGSIGFKEGQRYDTNDIGKFDALAASLGSQRAQESGRLPGLQESFSAAEAARLGIAPRVTTAEQARDFRLSEKAAAASDIATAKGRTSTAASQFQSLGEGIDFRREIGGLTSAAEVGKLGRAIQSALDDAIKELGDAVNESITSGVGALDEVIAKFDYLTQKQIDFEAKLNYRK